MNAGKQRERNSAGFAIIVVLWIMVLLSLLVTHIEQAGRGETELALNLRQAASLRAQADGAISIAAFHLLSKTADAWRPNGQPYVIAVGNDAFTRQITVRIESQAGKIDINTAPAPLLQALAASLGADPANARTVAGNILAWRSPGGAGPVAAVAAPYKQAGRDYGPPGAPFESIDELQLVLGVTPKLLASMAPNVTIAHRGNPEAGLAGPVVARAMAASGNALSAQANPASNALQIVKITATASGNGGTRFTREAILRLGRQKGSWMYILTWTTPGGQNAPD